MNWIAVTIIAAFFQNLRFTLQKNINKKVSTVASTYVRFLFALPFCIILFFGYFQNTNIIFEVIANENKFILYLILGSLAQIIFTFILLYLFKFSHFVVGTSLSKTEVIQISVLEFIILHDKLELLVVIGIIISTIGIIIFSVKNINFFLKIYFLRLR